VKEIRGSNIDSCRPISPSNFPNDTRSVSDPILRTKPVVGLPTAIKPNMAGSGTAQRGEAVKGMPRNSSMDSAISAISAKGHSHQASEDSPPGTPDIASLIKTAGSPEAVIQYLLKEKQSQSQQNSQLWRLVDKQRAMILGLNKDLERALKDKEKYRKKLKEVMAAPELTKPLGKPPGKLPELPKGKKISTRDVSGPKEQVVDAPESPNMDSDSQKHSPVDMAMAPYPITPPADHPQILPSTVGDLLDPAHAMPKPQEHAFDQFDHEADEKAADAVKKEQETQQMKDLPFNLSLPPSRSLPSEPPKMPPPKPPTTALPPPPTLAVVDATPNVDENLAQFPAPPPRKAPPAPLLLKGKDSATLPPEDDETDSDYDDILEVDEILDDKRGRRRTREEDDREREVLAFKEAEARSLSKKSKGSQKGTPREAEAMMAKADIPPSPRHIPENLMQRGNAPASLAGMLSGDEGLDTPPPPLLSPGLPSSPRPFGMKSPMNSPPMSPRGIGAFPAAPLSPRPPRQPIPLPPNTPMTSPPIAGEALALSTPKPLNIIKKTPEPTGPPSPTKSRQSPIERTRIFRGLVTDDYPDLLLPPNALPSIEVRVASSRMKPSRASLMSLTQLEEDPVFTLAVFSRSDKGELWRVEKDSVSLAKLDQRLKQCAAFTARTPERSLFSGHAPAKLDARRLALDHYLDELLNTPLDTATAIEFCRYLSTNTLPPNSDETGSVSGASVDTTSTRTGPGGRPLKSGYLTKRGKNFGGWKARFFLLDGPLLKYYETPGGAHLGTIKLPNSQIGKQSQANDSQSPARGGGDDADNQYRHAFLILEPKKKDSSSIVKHVLCAESDRERDQWVEALLQWIDYKDPDEEESHASKLQAHDRQGSGGSERVNGANAKKKMYSQNRPPQHQQTDSEGLIGVSYDSMRQGDTPQGVPGRPRTAGGSQDYHHNHGSGMDTMSSQSGIVISAPRDPQIISDSSNWSNKVGLAVPTTEEKKQRKRSFFGFGPKTRSSSDGQDSLFGGDGGAAGAPQQNEHKGPVRQVFGAPLAEAVRFNSPVDVNVPLPAVVFRCIQYLDAKNAVFEEGIFRLSGSNVVIKQLRERFNNESDVNLVTDEAYYDIHAVASLLKLYLRELPTTILTRDLHLEFLSVTEMTLLPEKVAALNELVQRLPQANATLLKYLIAFLIKIINNSDMNKMTVRNVGIVFSPTLNIPAPVFAMFLQNYEGIFGIEPEEYELPSPISESEPPQSRDGPPPRPSFEPQPRPSTSGTGASPHRQRLMDTMMTQPRGGGNGTPPPLLMDINQMRATPTPPPAFAQQRQTNYEPQYLAQQQAASHVSLRPAYESGFVLPQGYDVTQYQPPPTARANPGYDRPIYQSNDGDYGSPGLAAYDQQQSYGKRRESAVFMGGMVGLNHQGSKSRLREETRL
jgi:RalA-binding protein 1